MDNSDKPAPYLDYAVVTTPPQLVTDTTASLVITGTNTTGKLFELEALKIILPNGTNARDLINGVTGAHIVAPDGWQVDGDVDDFTLTPPAGGQHVNRSAVVIELNGLKINRHDGSSNITIKEVGTVGRGDGAHKVKGEKIITVTKVSPDLSIDAFTATPTRFEPGGSVILYWKGAAGATYTIEYDRVTIDHVKGDPDSRLPNEGKYQIDDLQSTTTFTLIVTKTGHDKPAVCQATATVERVDIKSFTAEPLEPLVGQSVSVNFVVEADEVTINPGGHVYHGKPGMPVVGAFEFEPTQEQTKVDLMAKMGKSMDDRQLTVTVQRPKIDLSFGPDDVAKTGVAQGYFWNLTNTKDHRLDVKVVGKKTGHVYYNAGPNEPVKAPAKGEWWDFHGFPKRPDLGVGETVTFTASTPWIKGQSWLEASKDLPYSGMEDLSASYTMTSFGGATVTVHAINISMSAKNVKSFYIQCIAPEWQSLWLWSTGNELGATFWSLAAHSTVQDSLSVTRTIYVSCSPLLLDQAIKTLRLTARVPYGDASPGDVERDYSWDGLTYKGVD